MNLPDREILVIEMEFPGGELPGHSRSICTKAWPNPLGECGKMNPARA